MFYVLAIASINRLKSVYGEEDQLTIMVYDDVTV